MTSTSACAMLLLFVAMYTYIDDNNTCDRVIDPNNRNQYIVWGVGGLGATAFQHFKRASRKLLTRTPAAVDHVTFNYIHQQSCDPVM